MSLLAPAHEALFRRLLSALDRSTLHHALMLEGPRGVGKRALATRLAQGANCTGAELPDGRPCGTCPTCRQIAQGVHPDVIMLEPDTSKAARTIPVDAVREVIRQSQYHRYSARHRFIVVDPAEAMQEPAANALLKTLEEPPDGTGFLVITHNPRALLPTILSRCQRVRLSAVPTADIRAWLQAEGTDDADAVARLAMGCPGLAADLAGSGLKKRRAAREALFSVLRAPLPEVYAYTSKLTGGGRQAWAPKVDAVLDTLEELLRDAAVVGSGSRSPILHEDCGSELEHWARALWPAGVTTCANAVQECRDDLEVYASGRTALDALLSTVRRELAQRPG